MEARLRSIDRLFKAVADPTRLRILGLLLGGELCVCHIHENLRIPQPKTSRHLAYLRRAGLVEARKRGLWVYYRLADPRDELGQTLLDAIHHCIGHLTTIRQDRARLERKTGCCIVAASAPSFRCCAEPTEESPGR